MPVGLHGVVFSSSMSTGTVRVEVGRQPWLEEPKGLLEKTSAWSSVKLSDPWAAPVLEHFSCDISAKRLTGGMIVKEFLAQRLVPLQAHSRPLWEYYVGDDELGLWSEDLPLRS
ncbi:hypothetical protein D1007_38522 [Hordeum vulgare]|nr:hypothetical protein D1007_38522 [Hordeum vulgare]